MKLNKVMIRGFRSIEDITIPLGGYGHTVLVGKNESGKSNILKALRLLAPPYNPFANEDEKMAFEKSAASNVTFEFALDKDEFAKCKQAFINKFHPVGIQLTRLKKHTAETFYNEHAKVLYRFSVGKKGEWGYEPVDNEVFDDWYLFTRDYNIGDKKFPHGSYIVDSYIKEQLHHTKVQELYQNASKQEKIDLSIVLHNVITETLTLNAPPPCFYWEYAPQYDLPNNINLSSFTSNPDSCLPLQRMFALAGYQREDIPQVFSKAQRMSYYGVNNLLKQICRETKKHIDGNWQDYKEEYKTVEIEMRKDGNDIISIGILDGKNTYGFNQRSDGFRKLISFLLLMPNTKNSIVLLDEPENGLHPSSARNFRDALISMGKENTVIYATHSISMIDTENVGNNLIVYKDGEDTKSKKAREDGASPGEIIYNAIGHSVYNDFKKQNILLEGYTDKKVLKPFMKGGEWEKFGICYTKGVNNIQYLMSLLELGGRQYCVLSDADNAAKEKQSELPSVRWYTYKDLGVNATTIEDFYMEEFFYNIVNAVLTKNSASGISLAESETSQDKGRLYSVRAELHKNKVGDVNGIMEQIKQECANQAEEDKMDEGKINSMLIAFLGKIQPADGGE